MKRALYVGRFQLMHKGHVEVVKFIDASPDIDEIVIAIGSSQYDHTNKSPYWPWANNPFTYDERHEIVEKSLEGEVEKPVHILPVPDYHNYPKWFKHIKDHLPETEVLYTSDRTETKWFGEHGYEVRGFPRNHSYHASILRERVYKGQPYRDDLAKGTLEVMDKVDGAKRIKMLFGRDMAERFRDGLK